MVCLLEAAKRSRSNSLVAFGVATQSCTICRLDFKRLDSVAAIFGGSARKTSGYRRGNRFVRHFVGKEMPRVIRGETTILEHLLPNNLLDNY